MVIVGFDEMKSLTIFSDHEKEISKALIQIGHSITFIDAKGGYSGRNKTIIYLIAERLQVSQIKEIVQTIDPKAFIAIENIQEVATVRTSQITQKHAKPSQLLGIQQPCYKKVFD